MALNTRDRDKVVKSIARWLAGLKPSFGDKHYFEKYSSAKRAAEKLNPYRGLRICPFCKKRFLRSPAFVSHLMKNHMYDLEKLIDEES
ncbi:MAG: hypothetical protein QW775_07765 [Ignisphaera sp.]|uniref:C2H2-type domain-containing protein n=1 Tax=Ignisphaera aggregans TaxID=334771 RepID=A0A7C4JKB2_9CREN